MALTQINIRLEETLKNEVHSTFETLGISPSQAVNAFYQYVRDNGTLPFTVLVKIENVPECKKTVFNLMCDVQKSMNDALKEFQENTFITVATKRSLMFALHSFDKAYESRYAELMEASGGKLDPAWMHVVNRAKIIYSQLAFGSVNFGSRVALDIDELKGNVKTINQYADHLRDNDNPFREEGDE
jgi:addiction module RelB/DinJ family antitoxin